MHVMNNSTCQRLTQRSPAAILIPGNKENAGELRFVLVITHRPAYSHYLNEDALKFQQT